MSLGCKHHLMWLLHSLGNIHIHGSDLTRFHGVPPVGVGCSFILGCRVLVRQGVGGIRSSQALGHMCSDLVWERDTHLSCHQSSAWEGQPVPQDLGRKRHLGGGGSAHYVGHSCTLNMILQSFEALHSDVGCLKWRVSHPYWAS